MTFNKPDGTTETRKVFNFTDNYLDGNKNTISELVKAIVEETIDHLISNMEIKNVSVADPLGIVETYAGGVGTNGGSLIAGAYPVVGAVVKPQQTLNQSNNGTGHIA
jgi:hypothetical protein